MLLWSLSGAPFHIMHALLLASASSETHITPSRCKKGVHLHCGASDTTVGFLQAIKHVCFACDWINNARPPVSSAANEFHRKKCFWAGGVLVHDLHLQDSPYSYLRGLVCLSCQYCSLVPAGGGGYKYQAPFPSCLWVLLGPCTSDKVQQLSPACVQDAPCLFWEKNTVHFLNISSCAVQAPSQVRTARSRQATNAATMTGMVPRMPSGRP